MKMSDQQSEIDRLNSELRRERDTSDDLRSRAVNGEDRLLALAAALGLRVDNNIPNMEVLINAISTLKVKVANREDLAREAQAEVRRLTIALEAEKAKSKPEDDLTTAAPY
jgi:hypothetical protein